MTLLITTTTNAEFFYPDLISTRWTLPTTVTQVAEDPSHIPWADTGDFYFIKNYDKSYTQTIRPMEHITNSFTGDRNNKSNYLLLSGFKFVNIPPNGITGIEAKLLMNRGGRITDETVQLRYRDKWIGQNIPQDRHDMITYYGGEDTLWGITPEELSTSTITTEVLLNMFNDPSFGIGIRYQSHPLYPHKTFPMIEYLALRLINSNNIAKDSSGGDGDGRRESEGSGGGGDGATLKLDNKKFKGIPYGENNPIPPEELYLGSSATYLGSFGYYYNPYQGSTGYIGSIQNSYASSAGTYALWPGVNIITFGKLLGAVATPEDLPPDIRYNPNAPNQYDVGDAYGVRSTQTFWTWDGYRFADTGSGTLA